jgi:hypothetical protein
MLNPKIHTLVIHLSAGLRENEVVKLLTNLLPNVATLKTIRFRKRQLKDMYAVGNKKEIHNLTLFLRHGALMPV